MIKCIILSMATQNIKWASLDLTEDLVVQEDYKMAKSGKVVIDSSGYMVYFDNTLVSEEEAKIALLKNKIKELKFELGE